MDQVSERDKQIQKIEKVLKLAGDAEKSEDICKRFGAFLLYAGLMDFFIIQAARLLEQIVLKDQLNKGQYPSFKPNEDIDFYRSYNYKKSSRNILNGIRKMLPFKHHDPTHAKEAAQTTDLANKMIDLGLNFFHHRDRVVHHIGNPEKSFED
ncbi:MAG: hypothetical protein HZA83_01190, partial [Thaumarchaeota archaeon]|nr:hypothetical protein [Nitrososphaerota archaeon]